MEQADSCCGTGAESWRNGLGRHHSYPADARSGTTKTIRDHVSGGPGTVRTSALSPGHHVGHQGDQALDRTQPGLPLKKGRCGTMTHDYKRNGTATLFAAMDAFDGKVISMCDDRHRHQEWLKFLRVIDQVTPPEKDLHLIVDNYATHKHPKVQRWLTRHPRFHVHFTPTSSSWLNMVIGEYIDKHNQNPKPFIWTAKASDILEKVKRARRTLDNRYSA